jgi:hypothetical protein
MTSLLCFTQWFFLHRLDCAQGEEKVTEQKTELEEEVKASKAKVSDMQKEKNEKNDLKKKAVK